jgi:hypothetical protein
MPRQEAFMRGSVVGLGSVCCRIAGSAAHAQGSITDAVQRQAVRGLAACELSSGNTPEAVRLYERLLGKEPSRAAAHPLAAFQHILGPSAGGVQPSPQGDDQQAEHWAHGGYGWALFEAGRLKVAACPSECIITGQASLVSLVMSDLEPRALT